MSSPGVGIGPVALIVVLGLYAALAVRVVQQ
jgi:hypothetical protein